jgi:predicted nucleotidyltransferase
MSNEEHVEMVIDKIVDICRRLGATSVILFGSRATGHFTEKSDIDIAVQDGDIRIIRAAVEGIPTLYSIDVVDFPKASGNLRRDIELYGKLLYKA